MALLALLLQATLPRLPQPATAFGSAAFDPHALCLAQDSGDPRPETPPGKTPGPEHHACAACCFASGGVPLRPAPAAAAERVAFARPLIRVPATLAPARAFFTHDIRPRAPPVRA